MHQERTENLNRALRDMSMALLLPESPEGTHSTHDPRDSDELISREGRVIEIVLPESTKGNSEA